MLIYRGTADGYSIRSFKSPVQLAAPSKSDPWKKRPMEVPGHGKRTKEMLYKQTGGTVYTIAEKSSHRYAFRADLPGPMVQGRLFVDWQFRQHDI